LPRPMDLAPCSMRRSQTSPLILTNRTMLADLREAAGNGCFFFVG